MRDHQFDIGDQFNQGALTSREQLDQANNEIYLLAKKTIAKVEKMKLISSQNQHLVSNQINTVATHAQKDLRSIDTQDQVELLLKRVNLNLKQLIASKQLKAIAHLVITRIWRSSLTDDQKSTAVNEIKTSKQFSMDDMRKATTNSSIKSSFAMGVNAINGALAKYVADSQINDINQIKDLANQVSTNLSKQSSVNDEIRLIVNRNLRTIKQQAVDNLLTSVNFVQLAKTQQNYISRLKAIATDKYHIIRDLTSFDQFMRQADNVIVSLSLSSDEKIRIETQINQYHDAGITKLEKSSKIDPKYLISVKHQITSTIISAMSRHYQRMIANQALTLGKLQRETLINQIKQTTNQLNKNPLQEPIKLNLMRALHRLNALVEKRRALVYQGQFKYLIDRINAKIDQLYDISQANRNYLKSQIAIFSQRIKDHKFDLASVTQTLQTFFYNQLKFVQSASLHKKVTGLLRQIHYSYLNNTQKQALNKHLAVINRNSKLSYSNQQLLIKNLNDYSVKLECKNACQHLKAISQIIYNGIDILTQDSLNSKFNQIQSDFSLKINDASQIRDVDHQAQLAENRMCQSIYHLKNSMKATKSKMIVKLVRQTHVKINVTILWPELRQLINDQLDQFFNSRIISLVNRDKAKDQLTQLKNDVQDYVKAILTTVKHFYIQRINNLTKSTRYQSMAYSSNPHVGDLNRLSSHAAVQIRSANNLRWTEAALQRGLYQINTFNDLAIDKMNSVKARAHQRIKKMLAVAKGYMSDHEDLLTSNHFLNAFNYADEQINFGLAKQTNDICNRCQNVLDKILRKGYLRVWSQLIRQAQLNILKLNRVPVNVKTQAIESMQAVNSQTALNIKQIPIAKLTWLIKTNQSKIQVIINHASYMDPAKRKVRIGLAQLIKQTKQSAAKYQSNQAKVKTFQALRIDSKRLDRQLSTIDDHQLQQIYQSNRKQLETWRLQIVRKAQLNRFDTIFQKVESRARALKFQANREVHQADAQFSRCYHKTRYDIQHSPNPEYCVHNEQTGEQYLNQIMTQCKASNSHKQRIYTAILDKVDHAKAQIQSLRYVQTKDKRSSLSLLKQIQKVAVHQVKKASTRQQIFAIEDHNYQAIKQVMNNVVSAGVILAAIQSANDRIAESDLSPQQKSNALKQIHQIINNGLKAQATQSAQIKAKKPTRSSRVADTQVSYDFAPRRTPKLHPLTRIVNAIGHFFRWLFGKLAQAL